MTANDDIIMYHMYSDKSSKKEHINCTEYISPFSKKMYLRRYTNVYNKNRKWHIFVNHEEISCYWYCNRE